MSDAAAAIALNDLADQVLAAADLDDDARRNADFDVEIGDPDFAIAGALLTTRTPLSADLLTRIRDAAAADWFSGELRDRVVAALDRQRH